MKYVKAIGIILGVPVLLLLCLVIFYGVSDIIHEKKSMYGQSRKHIWANEDVEPNVFFEIDSIDGIWYKAKLYSENDTVWLSGFQKGQYPSSAYRSNDYHSTFFSHLFLKTKGNKSDTLSFEGIDSLLGHSNLELYKMKKPTVK